MKNDALSGYAPNIVERHTEVPDKNLDKLSLRAREARKSGMSYGMYMAQNHPTYEKPEEVRAGRKCVCPACGKTFWTNKSYKKYCSEYCQQHPHQYSYKSYYEQTNGHKKYRGFAIVGTSIETGEEIRFEHLSDADEAGFASKAISHCLNGRHKSHRGYTWRRDVNGLE